MMDCRLADEAFGPAVSPACRTFDFTLLFEQSILSLLPNGLLLVLATWHTAVLSQKPTVTRVSWSFYTRMTLLLALFGLTIGSLAVNAADSRYRTPTSIASTVIECISIALAAAPLSYVAYFKTVRPAWLLEFYFFLTTIFTGARIRTLWLIGGELTAEAGLLTATFTIRFLLAIVEAVTKRQYIVSERLPAAHEATAGFWGVTLFTWVNSLVRGGYQNKLSQAIPSMSEHMLTETTTPVAQAEWHRSTDRKPSPSLTRAMLRAHFGTFLLGVAPRILLLAASIAQPFLVSRTLNWFSAESDPANNNIGYGLIGAFALVYIGIAFGEALSYHYANQLIVKVRGSLISMVYDKMLLLPETTAEKTSALTLMGTDTERIAGGLRWIHDLYGCLMQVIVAIYLLSRQVKWGALSVALLSIITMCSSLFLATGFGNASKIWLTAVGHRIDNTSALLDHFKSVKVTGIELSMIKWLQRLKLIELDRSGRYRGLLMTIVSIGFGNQALAPFFGLATYALVENAHGGAGLTTTRAFTALSILTLFTQPLDQIFQALPAIFGALASMQRIGEYLLQAELGTSPSAPEIVTDKDHEKAAMAIPIPHQQLTCIVGPVGCGKSTLLKSLLGEVKVANSWPVLEARADVTSYAGQSPWLVNQSIRENIVGNGEVDEKWLMTVVKACAIDADALVWPAGLDTPAGPDGKALSGGQRQRVALARAIYARNPVVLLDDVLSGADVQTDQSVARALFAEGGLLRGRTVVLALHTGRSLSYADHIVCMDSKGYISAQGSLAELRKTNPYVELMFEKMELLAQDASVSTAERIPADAVVDDTTAEIADELQAALHTPDRTTYAYYCRSLGIPNTALYFVSMIVFVFLMIYPSIWVQRWTDANDKHPGADLGLYIGVYALLGGLAAVAVFIGAWLLFMVMARRSSRVLHQILLDVAFKSPYWFHLRATAGTIINRFSQDMTLIDMDLPVSVVNTLLSCLLCIAQIIVVAATTRYFAATIPIYLGVFALVQSVYIKTGRQLRILEIECKAPLYAFMSSSATGLSHIRAFGWQPFASQNMRTRIDASLRVLYALYSVQQWLTLVLNLIVASMAVLVVGFSIVLRGQTSGGFIGVALVSLIGLGSNLKTFITSWTIMEQSMGAVTRIRSFELTTPREVQSTDGDDSSEKDSEHSYSEKDERTAESEVWPRHGGIEWENYSAGYSPESPLTLRHISLSIQSGEKVAICGRTGSGKSSLALSLLQMLDHRSGEIKVDGTLLSALPPQMVRSSINAVSQDGLLFGESVRFNLSPRDEECSDEAMREVLEQVGLWQRVAEGEEGLDSSAKALKLSHGEVQLLSLARALLRRQTSIVVLDEPTSALDVERERLIDQVIRDRWAQSTMLVVTHRLRNISQYDRVVVLHEGQVAETGTPTQLLSSEGSRLRAMMKEASATEPSM